MFPVWFFIVLMLLICYLLYATRATEDSLGAMGKTKWKHLLSWLRVRATARKTEVKG